MHFLYTQETMLGGMSWYVVINLEMVSYFY